MQLTVEYFGQLRVAAGVEFVTVDLPEGTDVLALVQHVTENGNRNLGSQLISEDGSVHPWIMIAVDDVATSHGTVLCDGQTVVLSAPISGG